MTEGSPRQVTLSEVEQMEEAREAKGTAVSVLTEAPPRTDSLVLPNSMRFFLFFLIEV